MILLLGKRLLFIGLIVMLLGVGCTQAPTETVMPTPEPTTQYYSLNVSISPSEAGSVSPAEGYFASGTELTLSVTPASGYTFDHWSGDASGSSTITNITMDSDKSIIAYFKSMAPSPLPKVSVAAAKWILDTDDNVVLVDVRSKAGFERSHIGGALSIPMEELETRYDEITRGAQVLVYTSCA